MTYSDTIQYLYNLRWFGAKFGLENTIRLAELAGKPQNDLSFIHVAGTNGKGSTCAMLESIYRASGLRVGLFTSPHLVHFSERIQVNRHPISESEVVRLMHRLKEILKKFPDDHHPTFFEVVTVLALMHFAEQECDLVIWETGMGGRLDATNIVSPEACVITNVQLDHQQWLGNTITEIAAEKAGIIKPGVPSITAAAEPAALSVISQTASKLGSPLTIVNNSDTLKDPLAKLELPLLGAHQRLNAALALATVKALANKRPLSTSAIISGLQSVAWAGRMQVIKTSEGRHLILDGAHNPAGAVILSAAFRKLFPQVRPALILGILKDKDWETMCRELAPLASRLYLTPVHSDRSATPEMLGFTCRQANPALQIINCSSVAKALQLSESESHVLCAGSLYLVGEILERLNITISDLPGERCLNDWQAKREEREHPRRQAAIA